MKFRNMILVLTVAFSAIFVGMIGTSYAYYISTGGTTVNVTTGNIDTGVSVVFNQSQYINVNTGVPVSDKSLASSSSFSLTPDKNILAGAEVAIKFSIVDLDIDSALRVADFKYEFTCDDGTNLSTLASGDGTSITDEVVNSGYLDLGYLSTTDNSFNIDNIYTCGLKVWLMETNQNQNHLMNKNFSGLMRVNVLFKK